MNRRQGSAYIIWAAFPQDFLVILEIVVVSFGQPLYSKQHVAYIIFIFPSVFELVLLNPGTVACQRSLCCDPN